MLYVNVEEDEFDGLTISYMVDCFLKNGESGPHNPVGGMLCHVLNHCYKSDIPFTLVYIPKKGYYVKRGIVPDVIPKEVMDSPWMTSDN